MTRPTFTPRTVDCDCCFEGHVEVPSGLGYVPCDECEGRGELDQSCEECGVIRPLNDDGLCSDCWHASLTPDEIAELRGAA